MAGLDRPMVIHGVQHVSPATVPESWPGDDRRTRLVVIAKTWIMPSCATVFSPWLAGPSDRVVIEKRPLFEELVCERANHHLWGRWQPRS